VKVSKACLVSCTLLLLFSTSCITYHSTGPTGKALKNNSLKSPLIHLSDEFYPGDKPETTEGIVKSLSKDSVADIQKELRARLDGLKKAHTYLHKYLEAEMGISMPSVLPVNLEVAREGTVTEEIRSDNTIYIDLEVLQAFFKTAIIDLSKSSGIGHHDPTPTTDENQIVQNFLEFKRDLRRSKGHTGLGELFHNDDDWFEQISMNEEMTRASSRYYGVLLFTMAHELGHYALGHLKERCNANDCPRFAERELAADRYAVAMMSALVPELPGIFAFMDFDNNREQLRGYEPFFHIGYKLARFSSMSSCSCAYPAPDERMALAKAEQERATKRLYEEGWMKIKPAGTGGNQ